MLQIFLFLNFALMRVCNMSQNVYERQKQRDEEKAALSKANGIKLVYINYWEEITPELKGLGRENIY